MLDFNVIPFNKNKQFPRWILEGRDGQFWTGKAWGRRSEATLYASKAIAAQDGNQNRQDEPQDNSNENEWQ